MVQAALQDRAERNLEVAARCAIDIGQHILASLGAASPDSYRQVFLLLAQEGVVPPELAQRLAAMARFRNILAHGYVIIDPRRVYQPFPKKERDRTTTPKRLFASPVSIFRRRLSPILNSNSSYQTFRPPLLSA